MSTDFVRSLDESPILDWLSIYGVFASLAAFMIGGLIHQSKKKSGASTWPAQAVSLSGLACFFITIAASLFLYGNIERVATLEIQQLLSNPPESITVDGTRITNFLPLLNELRTMQVHDHPGNHEQPLPRIYTLVVETAATRLTLLLRRYTSHPHEYVVLYPAYRRTRDSPVGHIATDALDGLPE